MTTDSANRVPTPLEIGPEVSRRSKSSRLSRWKSKPRLLVGACVLFLLFLGTASAATFTESPCPFLVVEPEVEGETIICGDLEVLENRSRPGSDTISLKVAIVRGTGGGEGASIVYLEGGPGGAAVVSVPDVWVESGLRQHGDIIVFDQRGAGYSQPSLDCTELVDEDSDDPVGDCREELLAAGVDLDAYNSRENAADVADLLAALDIDEASLYGISYGTRLALTVVRDHPERIGSVIIDGVYPPHVQGLEEQAVFGNRAFELLFEDCEADLACDDEFPELRETFLEMVDYLNSEPMLDEDGVEIFGDDVLNEVFQLLYDTAAIPYLPALIYAAWDGDYEAYLDVKETIEASAPAAEDDAEMIAYEEALDRRLIELLDAEDADELYELLGEMDDEEYDYWIEIAMGDVDTDSDGMFNSIECQEEVPFNDLDLAFDLAEDLPEQVAYALLTDVEAQFSDCDTWGVQMADPIENEPVVSDIPTLIFSGQYDPITPPAWGDEAAEYLANSYHFVFPAMGHGTIDAHACPTAIALSFLADPFSEPDSSCLERMGPPRFYLPVN